MPKKKTYFSYPVHVLRTLVCVLREMNITWDTISCILFFIIFFSVSLLAIATAGHLGLCYRSCWPQKFPRHLHYHLTYVATPTFAHYQNRGRREERRGKKRGRRRKKFKNWRKMKRKREITICYYPKKRLYIKQNLCAYSLRQIYLFSDWYDNPLKCIL